MSITWYSDDPEPQPRRLGPLDWLVVAGRGLPVVGLILVGLAVLLPVRLVERATLGAHRRPVSTYVPHVVFRLALAVIGLGYRRHGRPMAGAGALVSNHVSWLDIFSIYAAAPVVFVSKAEVAAWPGIGPITRAGGTLYIRRDRTEAAAQSAAIAERLAAGQKLVVFPEGTSTDGLRILPFRTALFQAFLDPAVPRPFSVQPVTIRYVAPPNADPRVYAWWGDMDFATGLAQTLSRRPQGRVEVTLHPPIAVTPEMDRKRLAQLCEQAVRSAVVASGKPL